MHVFFSKKTKASCITEKASLALIPHEQKKHVGILDNDIIHFLLGVWYTRCILASRLAVCDEAREMTQHTETSSPQSCAWDVNKSPCGYQLAKPICTRRFQCELRRWGEFPSRLRFVSGRVWWQRGFEAYDMIERVKRSADWKRSFPACSVWPGSLP